MMLYFLDHRQDLSVWISKIKKLQKSVVIAADFFFGKGCITLFKVVYLSGRILAGGSYGKRDYLYYGNRGSRDY